MARIAIKSVWGTHSLPPAQSLEYYQSLRATLLGLYSLPTTWYVQQLVPTLITY